MYTQCPILRIIAHAVMFVMCVAHAQGGMEDKQLQPPAEFPFPFQPYGIQEQFMRALYSALEGGCIGIFESPTGTVRTHCAWGLLTPTRTNPPM